MIIIFYIVKLVCTSNFGYIKTISSNCTAAAAVKDKLLFFQRILLSQTVITYINMYMYNDIMTFYIPILFLRFQCFSRQVSSIFVCVRNYEMHTHTHTHTHIYMYTK
jgi:hypothetical protein